MSAEDVGYINPRTLSSGNPQPFIQEENWRDVGQEESLKAKLIVLYAFGGKLPEADKSDWITYKKNGPDQIRMEAPHPDSKQKAWRGVSRSEKG